MPIRVLQANPPQVMLKWLFKNSSRTRWVRKSWSNKCCCYRRA